LVDLSTIILVVQVAGTIAGSWLVGEVLIRLITRIARRAGASSDVVRTVRRGLSVLWVVLAAAGVLTLTGVTSEFSVLTLSGLVGLAVSLALKTTLSNIISGILLFYDGALRLNDQVSYGGINGKVVKIGFRNTWVSTDDGSIAIISNNNLAGGPLINQTAAERLQKRL